MDIYTAIGILGGAIELIAFALNNFKIVSNENVLYDTMNVIGSFLLVIYASYLNSIPFVIINIVWGAVSLLDVLKYLLKRVRAV